MGGLSDSTEIARIANAGMRFPLAFLRLKLLGPDGVNQAKFRDMYWGKVVFGTAKTTSIPRQQSWQDKEREEGN